MLQHKPRRWLRLAPWLLCSSAVAWFACRTRSSRPDQPRTIACSTCARALVREHSPPSSSKVEWRGLCAVFRAWVGLRNVLFTAELASATQSVQAAANVSSQGFEVPYSTESVYRKESGFPIPVSAQIHLCCKLRNLVL